MTDESLLTVADAAMLRQGFKFCPRCCTPLVDKFIFGRTRRVCPNADCRFVQFIDPKLTTAVMVMKDDKVLMLKRAMDPGRGSWSFPGGFMEMGETPQQSACRECKEETGFDIEITRLLDVYYYEDFRGSGVAIMYTGKVVSGEAAINPHESEALGFFGPDELPEPIIFESNLQALANWRAGKI